MLVSTPLALALVPLAPELTLVVTALGLILVSAWRGEKSIDFVLWGCIASAALAFFMLGYMNGGIMGVGAHILSDMVVIDGFSLTLKMFLIFGLLISLMASNTPMHQDTAVRPEYPILMVFATIGMMGMVSAHNFLSLYVMMEMQSLALYILVASGSGGARSAEAGVKYVLLGALASGLMLFGMALIYGTAGVLDYGTIRFVLEAAQTPSLAAGAGLTFILTGMAFKISAVPFHMWTPDVYAGAPTRVTAFLAVAPKVAAAGALARLLFDPLLPLANQAMPILLFLCIASMTWGALAGLMQKDIKRLMAYSAIGNMGYMLLGFIVGGQDGLSAAFFYVALYAASAGGVFAALLALRRDGQPVENLDDLSGLARSKPFLAAGMATLMLSLAGVPPLAGFFAKFIVFKTLIDFGMVPLAVYGLITSVVAAFYYLRIVKTLYCDEPALPFDKEFAPSPAIVLGASAFLVVALIFAPGPGLDMAKAAVSGLF